MRRDSIPPSGRSGRVGATDLSSQRRFGRSEPLAALNFALSSVNLQRGRAIPSHGSFQSTPRIRKVRVPVRKSASLGNMLSSIRWNSSGDLILLRSPWPSEFENK